MHLVCFGAGFAGITLADKVIRELKLERIVDFTISERQVRPPGLPLNDRPFTWTE